MNLQLQNNGEVIIHLHGNIDFSNAEFIKSHIEHLLDNHENIALNIENIVKIDHQGMAILQGLYFEALSNSKKFSIIGSGCKEIYDHFKGHNAA